jgi:hypothetical protein
MEKEKIKVLLPGESLPQDTTLKTKHPVSSIVVGLLVTFILTSILFLILCKDYPFHNPDKTALELLGHYWNFILGLISTSFVSTGFKYNAWLFSEANKIGVAYGLLLRWLACIGIGSACGIYIGLKTYVARGGVIHKRGMQVLEGLQAYFELKGLFNTECINPKIKKKDNGSGLLLAVDPGVKFDPRKQTLDDLKPGTFIEKPQTVETQHSVVVAPPGSGKTQSTLYRVAQSYNRIKRKERKVRMLICDTPKDDYSRFIHPEMCHTVAPHLAGSIPWWVGKDICTRTTATDFWAGIIQIKEGEVWGPASITTATGLTFFLQVMAGMHWNFGMLGHLMTKTPQEVEPILAQYHPEALQIIRSGEDTVGSVLMNLASYTGFLIELGRIWDGFDTKKVICQATAGALKNTKYVDFVKRDMQQSMFLDMEERANFLLQSNDGIENDSIVNGVMFKAACMHLNNTNKNWSWKDFSNLVEMNFEEQKAILFRAPNLNDTERNYVEVAKTAPTQWLKLCSYVYHYHKEWDRLEGAAKLSIGDWLQDDSSEKRILIMKPSSLNKTLTKSLIRAILSYSNKVILDKLPDDSSRRFSLIIDEFNSYGNIKDFIGDALEMYRSKGVSITFCFQDFSQPKETYGEAFADFLKSIPGSLAIVGANLGKMAEEVSQIIGERTIAKAHRSTSYSDGGKSTSEDLQEHQEVVITADEVSSKLGAKKSRGTLRYLYITKGAPKNAYIIEQPLMNYYDGKGKNNNGYDPMPAEWVGKPYKEHEIEDIHKIWNRIDIYKSLDEANES